MKRPLAFLLFAALAPLAAGAQDGARADFSVEEKAAWRADVSLGELGYNPDHGLGLAGGFAIRHGDVDDSRDNRHLFDLRAAWHSEGASEVHFRYDSHHLLPWGVRLTVGAHYSANPVAAFRGFGGAASPYYRELDRRGGVAFYAIGRDVARASVDLGGDVLSASFGRAAARLLWSAGASFTDYKIGSVTHKKYAAGADNSLYNLYRKYGLISDAEAAGGRRAEFSAGLALNAGGGGRAIHTLDAKVEVRVSPDMFDRRADYAKLNARISHTMMIMPALMTLEYRLGYEGTVWSQGPVPFYAQSELAAPLGGMPSGGLGGQGSLRGVLQNRVVGEGVTWGGVDVTANVARFRLLRQDWRVSPSVFVDAGAVVQPFRLDAMRAVWNDTWRPAEERRLVYSGLDEQLHATAGVGINIHNAAGWSFYALWGKPFARQDGPGAVYAGLKWRF